MHQSLHGPRIRNLSEFIRNLPKLNGNITRIDQAFSQIKVPEFVICIMWIFEEVFGSTGL